MLRPVAVRQRREAVSSCQDFIPHEVKPDQPGCFHGFIEVAIHGVFHHHPQLSECVAFGVDAITQCGGCLPPSTSSSRTSKMISLMDLI
jgi:hypothetical protein